MFEDFKKVEYSRTFFTKFGIFLERWSGNPDYSTGWSSPPLAQSPTESSRIPVIPPRTGKAAFNRTSLAARLHPQTWPVSIHQRADPLRTAFHLRPWKINLVPRPAPPKPSHASFSLATPTATPTVAMVVLDLNSGDPQTPSEITALFFPAFSPMSLLIYIDRCRLRTPIKTAEVF